MRKNRGGSRPHEANVSQGGDQKATEGRAASYSLDGEQQRRYPISILTDR